MTIIMRHLVLAILSRLVECVAHMVKNLLKKRVDDNTGLYLAQLKY